MNDNNFLETLAASLNQNTSVKDVFGEPIQVGDKVIIPVAQVMRGMGGGYGQSNQQPKQLRLPDPSRTRSLDKPETPAEGVGGGGGMRVLAKGVYEVSPKGTRFIPTHTLRHVLVYLTIGFLCGRLFRPKLTSRQL